MIFSIRTIIINVFVRTLEDGYFKLKAILRFSFSLSPWPSLTIVQSHGVQGVYIQFDTRLVFRPKFDAYITLVAVYYD